MAKLLILILSSLLLLLCCSATSTLPVVRRAERKQLMVTEYGEISSVDVRTAAAPTKGPYHVEFITLDPNSLFLPVLLHADMVFYVHSGSGKLSWTGDGEDEVKRVDLKRGDVYRLEPGSVFFLQSDLENERQKLRIHAIFSTTDEDIWEPWIGAYSSISDLVLGFNAKLLQSSFGVTEGVIEEITSTPKPPGIVHAPASESSEEKEKKKKKSVFYELENRFLKVMAGEEAGLINLKKSKKSKTFNILEADPDFHNCNGWSLTVDKGNYKTLKGSNMGVFMVNLTKGAMMGPHWNPMATEIAVVLEGEGMVRIICASNSTGCKNERFIVREGDVFVVPRFHPMAQMSFNNGSFVFMGFSTTSKKNHPQFLVGKSSVFQTLDREVLALAFNASNTTIDQLLLASQEDAIILECVSCAEEEFRLMVEEIEREREREEEERKREEEEERRKREEEEEEERKRQEEEERKRQEEEEERKRQEEEERKRREEEEERKRQEEEERREREEEARRQKEEEARKEQEQARKEEEERKRRREEAEEEAQQKREEEEERRQQEEARKEEEERERQRREEEEAAREKEEEEERQRREEAAREKEEEEATREQEEARRQEEERQRRREEEEAAAARERREEAAKEEEEGGGGGGGRRSFRELPLKL
ncbi:unnamed protein product [Linum tenue]|uniref:Cupin type-1 domain-containing protein n=1 Tax=Linum tenue TaxID=586396 RepID=A0AAV0KDL2_9ROSI|nr:unnamed protein product [Linum tenue]